MKNENIPPLFKKIKNKEGVFFLQVNTGLSCCFIRNEENNFDASHSIKMEPCGINITEVIKEEETGDNLSDNENIYGSEVYDNIDKIDIEEFKLEEPDV